MFQTLAVDGAVTGWVVYTPIFGTPHLTRTNMTSPQETTSILKRILQTNGLDLLRSPQRLRGLLTDQAPQQPRRERDVLVHAVNSPIFERAWQAGSGSLGGLAQWLADEHGYATDLCQWAEKTWVLALSLHPTPSRRSAESPRPLATGQPMSSTPHGPHSFQTGSSVGRQTGLSAEALIAQLQNGTLSHQQRFEIGQALARIGDPRPGVGLRGDGLPDIAWIQIPGGQVRIDPEAPTGFLSLLPFRRTFEVRPFQMAKFPVTNAQFQAFFSATDGYHFWTWWKDINKSRDAPCFPGKEQANEPRVNVTWYDAIAFCRWFSAKTGTTIRLPTEWEWRQAATGGDPTRDYPWGSEWDSSRCSSRESMATAVGMYPAGSSLQGLHDITGNVWEWGLNRPETTPSRPDTVQVERYGTRAILGGFWNSQPQDLKTFIRSYTASDDHTSYLGFRLVQEH